MNWIRVSVGITHDPRVYALADDLEVRPAEVVGLLIGVMAALPEHAPTGDLTNVPQTLIERWAGWDGVRGAFAVRFATRFLNDGVWAAWEKYNGSALREAKSNAERAKAARNARKRGSTAYGTPNGTANETETSPIPSASTRRDETRRNEVPPTTTSRSSEKLDEPVSQPKAKAERKYPHFPHDLRAALYERWREKGGVLVEFPRFVREVAVLFDRPEAEWGFTRQEAYDAILIAREWALATDRIARNNFESGNLTPGRWAGAFRSTHLPNVRMGTVDRDGIATAFGALIDRSCAAVAA